MDKESFKRGVEASLKSRDTEEFIDIHFHRPLGYLWALLFKRMGVHPNTVSIASIFIGVASGWMFYYDNLWLNALGMFLLVWADTFDSADGQLARMTNKKTAVGRMLDGFSSELWFVSIYAFICLRLTPEWGIWIWILAAVSGLICHAKQAALADYYRNMHLLFLKGKSGSELDNYETEKQKYNSLTWKNDFSAKLFQFFYVNYTHSQEQMIPKCQRFLTLLNTKYGEELPQSLRDEFRQMSKPLMKYTNILSFNTRAIALFVSIFMKMPWLYFIFEIVVLNVLFFYMRYRHETICKTLYEQLTSVDGEK
ncbi:MAG: CDP-alcohol phosphatidyltransferase family protein [Bacteroides sp.]